MTDRRDHRKSGANTGGRKPNGTFAPGNRGKPRGARHKATMAVQGLLNEATGRLTERAIELALGGDTVALRLCLERLCPSVKDAPVHFELGAIETAADAAKASSSIVAAMAKGEITPSEASGAMAVVDSFRRTLEVAELETRIAALEARK